MRIKSITKIKNDSLRYDIGVSGNHNFYANGILVHNCQNFPDVLKELKGKRVYITVKMDGCCDEDTLLNTEDGDKTIKEVCETRYSGKILCFDIDSKKTFFSNITDWFVKENNNDWYELETEDGAKIKLTGNHPVFVPELNCYRRVDQLLGNEKLLLN